MEKHTSGLDCVNVDHILNENERNKSDGDGDMGEEFTGHVSPESDGDEDGETIETEDGVDPFLI